jgi:predicted glycosyltransferase
LRILVDILHPAHVHFFRNFSGEMRGRGHEVLFTARSKDHSLDLLDAYGLEYRHLTTQGAGRKRKATELLDHTRKVMNVMREFRPDALTGIMGPAIAIGGKLRRVPAVVFYDTEFATQTNRFVYPLAHSVVTPDCYQGRVRGRHVTYAGYHELAYLHPNRFTPDASRLDAFGVAPDEPYSLVRFVSWQATHDRYERGLTAAQKEQLVAQLGRYGRVLVSSEAPLPEHLKPMELRGPRQDVHHLMAFAQTVVGESATMASEAAVLGVPAVFIATTGRGYTDDEEARYKLVRHLKDDEFDRAVAVIDSTLGNAPREFGRAARERLLAEKIDVTAWMVEYFEKQFPGA